MECLRCQSKNVATKNSRKYPSTVWRRRNCKNCGLTFTTKESVDIAKLLCIQESVRKKHISPYSRGKLLQTLYEVLGHKDDPDIPLNLLATVEEALVHEAAKKDFIITTAKLHEITIAVLGRYDSLAALTYNAHFNK